MRPDRRERVGSEREVSALLVGMCVWCVCLGVDGMGGWQSKSVWGLVTEGTSFRAVCQCDQLTHHCASTLVSCAFVVAVARRCWLRG